MGEFIVGVIMDVNGHVLIEHIERFSERWISASARFFAVYDSAEFVVLNPEIGLENFRGGGESEQGGITFGEMIVGALALSHTHTHIRGQESRTGY